MARALVARGVQNLLLEGGATLAGAWWAEGLIDHVVAYVAPRVLCGEVDRSPLRGPGSETVGEGRVLVETEVTTVGSDVCVSGYVRGAY